MLRLLSCCIFLYTFTGQTVYSKQIVRQSKIISIDKQIENYFTNLKSLSADFAQSSDADNEIHKAHIWLVRGKKSNVRVKYQTGEVKEISMHGRYLTIINRKTNKSRTYSILTTPIYAILSGEIVLKDLDYQIFGDNNHDVSILIRYNNKQTVIMTFSKSNNKINQLVAWTISDAKSNIHVGFNSKNYLLNSHIPDIVFK